MIKIINYKEMLKYIFLALSLLVLSSCTGENCIDADDFGHTIVNVPARYSPEDFEGQVEDNQVSDWIASGYTANGRPLSLMVKNWSYLLNKNEESELSAWCPWYGSTMDGNKLSVFCERLPDCEFIDDEMCIEAADAPIANAPCLLRNGIGLYALVAAIDTDPNLSLSTKKEPQGVVLHLAGASGDYDIYDLDAEGNQVATGGIAYTYEDDVTTQQQYNGSQIYFKILDKFYDDNNGQYRVVIKGGVTSANSDPISYVTMLVKQFLFGLKGNGEELLPGLAASNVDNVFMAHGEGGIIKKIYLGVVNNEGYRFAVSALLVLYVMFTAMSYLAGNIQVTQTELVMRVGKIAVVSALLSTEYSWSFFHDYVFVYFIGGVEQILQIIQNAGATGPGAPGILAMMIAPQTLAKLFALLFVDWLGWLYIILFIIAIYFIILIFFKATVIYLTALISIGLIIVMGPIFICFLLFGITRSFFENWLKQLISYALQPVILFTGLMFISVILREEFYGALGFRVCKIGFPLLSTSPILTESSKQLLGFDPGNTLFYWWFPNPKVGADFTRETARIPIPIDHFAGPDETGDIKDGFCEAYGCIGERYPDLPFLDPGADQDRIDAFWSGIFLHLDSILLIFACLYLLHKFNGTAVMMSKSLTGTTGNLSKTESVADAAYDKSFGKMHKFAASLPGKAKGKVVDAVDRKIGRKMMKKAGVDTTGKSKKEIKAMEKFYGKSARLEYSPSALIDKGRIRMLKGEALTFAASGSVLSEVKKKTGMKRSDIDSKATSKYKKELGSTLKNMGYDDKKAKKISEKLYKVKPENLKGELSKAKYGKSLKDLNEKERKDIEKIHGNRNLRKLALESDKARRFKTAYANAHADMSARGIGILGKHSRVARFVEEVRFDMKQTKKKKEQKRAERGERIISKIEGVKHKTFTKVAGKREFESFRRNFAGGAYHDVNTGDQRKRTHAEVLSDNKKQRKSDKVHNRVENYSKRYGENVTSPEFLAKAQVVNHSKMEKFRELERAELRDNIDQALKSGDDPVIAGNSYMKNFATDSQMRDMVDNAYKKQEEFFESDKHIGREAEYEMRRDLARDMLGDEHKKLSEYYGTNDFSIQDMPELARRMERETGGNDMNRAKEIQDSMVEFKISEAALEQIDNKKAIVAEEVRQNIERINEYRSKAKMEQYRPQPPKLEARQRMNFADLARMYREKN